MKESTRVRRGRFGGRARWVRGRHVATTATLFTLTLIAGFLCLGLPQAAAMDIQMNFQSGSSAFPAYDPDGSKLIAMMDYIEGYYEDIFEHSWTLEVNFYYENLDGGTLAVHNNQGTSGGRPTECRIRVDTDRTWFFDTTPGDDSEFNMTQTLYRNLNATQKANFFNGSPNNFLEVSYKGSANGTGPTESQTGHDLLSILLHEMGHGLGMTGNVAWWEVLFDSDYDFDSDLIWGGSTAAKCYSSDNKYHLASTSLMYPYSSVGQRHLPSATDIFAIQAASDWSDTGIDLRRQDFYSSSANANFNNPDCWEGHQVPGSGGDAWVRHSRNATLSADRTVNNFYVNEGSTVYTGAYQLRADQSCNLGDGSNVGTVEVDPSGEFQVDNILSIYNGSKVRMDPGSLLDVDTLNIYSGGEVVGAGTIDIEAGINCTGKITVSGGNLTIDSDVAVNLDGNGNGQLYVTGGNFSCNKALSDSHDGYIEIGAGRTATFTEGFVLNSGGEMYIGNLGTIGGGTFENRGILEVDGTAIVDGVFVHTSTATLVVTPTADGLSSCLDVGDAWLAGDLELDFAYSPDIGDQFAAFWFDTINGAFSDIYASDPNIELMGTYYPQMLIVTVTGLGDASMAAVPEPGFLGLLIGPMGLWFFRRKRR
ncbi:MAG: hypothetical protein JW818_03910 [Pirellulales bacterium]|nr:hypothetical protein [Pirellulales bacterium]